jgi:hypothetical protein
MDSHAVALPWFGNQVHVHNLFYDPTGWDANNPFSEADINAATSALVRSGYFDGLQQYGIPHPAFDGGINSSGDCNPLASIGSTGPQWTDLLKFMSCEGATPLSGVVGSLVAPTPQAPITNIYNLFIPNRGAVSFPDGSKSCTSFDATHAATVPLVFFAILPIQCANDIGSLMSMVSHEDVETLTDPVIGLGLFDNNSANLPSLGLGLNSLDDFITFLSPITGAAIFIAKYAVAAFNMNSEISDVCEPAPAGFYKAPGGPGMTSADFQFVPMQPFGIKMEVASYWSNADHACVVGGSGERVVQASFAATGLPLDAPSSTPVFGPDMVNPQNPSSPNVTDWTNPVTGTPFVARETAGYAFGNVTVDGATFFPTSGGCSGEIGFPSGVVTPSTQVQPTIICTYSTTPPGLPGTGAPPAPPTVSAGPPVAGAETGPIWLSGSVTDPFVSPTVNWSVTSVSGTTDPGASCTFADPTAPQTAITCSDEGVYNVTLTANDGVNPPVGSSTTVTVNNLGPSLSLTLPPPWQPLQAPAAVSLTAPITDPGANDTHTCTINWDDGTTETFAHEGSCDRTHSYTAPGVYTINVTVTDDDQRTASASGIVVVFDPGAGFVTGGGYINSPLGAYTPNSTVGGKAHFVMQSSYPDGSTTPTGNVSVFLQDIHLRMDATSLDWLVVSPDGEAAVKGSGTMGGQDVRFIMYGYQGCGSGSGTGCQPGPDAFRAVIWPASQGSTPTAPFLYDNVPGADLELADATPQPLDGGNIQIHS